VGWAHDDQHAVVKIVGRSRQLLDMSCRRSSRQAANGQQEVWDMVHQECHTTQASSQQQTHSPGTRVCLTCVSTCWCSLILKWQLFIMPMRFQVRWLGCVFMLLSHARTSTSLARANSTVCTSNCQKIQHQCLPGGRGVGGLQEQYRGRTVQYSQRVAVRRQYRLHSAASGRLVLFGVAVKFTSATSHGSIRGTVLPLTHTTAQSLLYALSRLAAPRALSSSLHTAHLLAWVSHGV
jgi:hypothetical protein